MSYFKDHVYGVLEESGHAPDRRPACFCSVCGGTLDGLLEPGPEWCPGACCLLSQRVVHDLMRMSRRQTKEYKSG